ncbi:MAG: hypothetical protein WA647_02900, partial [Candidatus Acidiferrum sp.]
GCGAGGGSAVEAERERGEHCGQEEWLTPTVCAQESSIRQFRPCHTAFTSRKSAKGIVHGKSSKGRDLQADCFAAAGRAGYLELNKYMC